jgi:hypothetical protein
LLSPRARLCVAFKFDALAAGFDAAVGGFDALAAAFDTALTPDDFAP